MQTCRPMYKNWSQIDNPLFDIVHKSHTFVQEEFHHCCEKDWTRIRCYTILDVLTHTKERTESANTRAFSGELFMFITRGFSTF